jgi:DUF4097 and DUF4098 domain-containing protein YvlB
VASCTAGAGAGTAKVTQVSLPSPTERAAALRFDVSSAELKLAGGAAGLLEGSLTFPSSETSPTMAVGSKDTASGKVATVDLKENAGGVQLGGAGSVWDLKLNGGLPTDVHVASASGKLDLDLGVVDVKDVSVVSQSGEADLKLKGPHPSLSSLAVSTQSGKLDLDASGEFPAVEEFKVATASGELALNVSGTWRKSFTIRAVSQSGAVTLVLPRDCNVVVSAGTSSGQVSADGFDETPASASHVPPSGGPDPGRTFTRKGDKYAETTLTVRVTTQSGAITLKLPEKK